MDSRIEIEFSEGDKPETDFSDFFYNASAEEKKKLMLEILREAAEVQRRLIEKYERLKKKRDISA